MLTTKTIDIRGREKKNLFYYFSKQKKKKQKNGKIGLHHIDASQTEFTSHVWFILIYKKPFFSGKEEEEEEIKKKQCKFCFFIGNSLIVKRVFNEPKLKKQFLKQLKFIYCLSKQNQSVWMKCQISNCCLWCINVGGREKKTGEGFLFGPLLAFLIFFFLIFRFHLATLRKFFSGTSTWCNRPNSIWKLAKKKHEYTTVSVKKNFAIWTIPDFGGRLEFRVNLQFQWMQGVKK